MNPQAHKSLVALKIGFQNMSNSSVIRQKGESQNGCFKKTKQAKFSKKPEHFLPPDTHTYVCVSGGKKCSFFEKFGVLCFLETPLLRLALLPYYRRIILFALQLMIPNSSNRHTINCGRLNQAKFVAHKILVLDNSHEIILKMFPYLLILSSTAGAVLRTQSNIYDVAFLGKWFTSFSRIFAKGSIIDVRQGSKYTSILCSRSCGILKCIEIKGNIIK